jgi:hypothetical protein
MFDPTDLLGYPAGWLVVVLVANLVIVLVAHALLVGGLGTGLGRRLGDGAGRQSTDGSGRATSEERGTDPQDTGGSDRVTCPNCLTTNEAGYRFCRECLGELPGAGLVDAGRSDPERRPLP